MLMDETEMEDSKLEGVHLLSSECGTYTTGTAFQRMWHIEGSHSQILPLAFRKHVPKIFWVVPAGGAGVRGVGGRDGNGGQQT
jgi:hypothetical protein